MLSWDFKFSWQNLVNPILFSLKLGMGPQALASYTVYICLLSTSIHKERSLSVSRRLPQFTVEKNVSEFLYDLKLILYLKYDNFSTTWCMTRLLLLPIIYVRAHYIIQLEIHKNTSYFSSNTATQQWIKQTVKSPVKNTRGFFLFCLCQISIYYISGDKVHNFVVNIVDLNEFISYCLLFLDT